MKSASAKAWSDEVGTAIRRRWLAPTTRCPVPIRYFFEGGECQRPSLGDERESRHWFVYLGRSLPSTLFEAVAFVDGPQNLSEAIEFACARRPVGSVHSPDIWITTERQVPAVGWPVARSLADPLVARRSRFAREVLEEIELERRRLTGKAGQSALVLPLAPRTDRKG